ncbi:MAG: arsenite methyltransferase [Candidatus Bathyarchaeota archaeon]|nr:arsenite methyltransferase [Candidatus Bathyarchaeota archaeon]
MTEEKIHKIVRQGYGKIAKQQGNCCGCGCGSATNVSEMVGYNKEELDSVPKGADLNLGCGNPVALASLKSGETVVDLGSGGGLDCFIASKKVGVHGKVIGVDMTPEMLDRARTNQNEGKYSNVEFRLGEIENLPIADNTTDVIISNCVINLSPNKQRVFEEAFRVLKPKGRLMISDMVLLKEIPKEILNNVAAYVGCIAGAEKKDAYLRHIKQAGFAEVEIVEETPMPIEALISQETVTDILNELKITMNDAAEIFGAAISIKVTATKPE